MKILLSAILSLISLVSLGQIGTAPSQKEGNTGKTVRQVGSYAIDEALIGPKKDTNFIPFRAGAYTLRPQDGAVYYYDSTSTGKRWVRVAKKAEISQEIKDSLQGNVFFFENGGVALDSLLYIVNDSTIGVKRVGFGICMTRIITDSSIIYAVDTACIRAFLGGGGGGGGSSYYQNVEAAGAARPQRTKLNYGSEFIVSDNAGNTSTDINVKPGTTSQAGLLTTADHIKYDSGYVRIVVLNDSTFKGYRANGDSGTFVIKGGAAGPVFSLPAQATHNSHWLRTNGTNPAWENIEGIAATGATSWTSGLENTMNDNSVNKIEIGGSPAKAIEMRVSNTARMRIETTGNVTVISPLEVQDSVKFNKISVGVNSDSALTWNRLSKRPQLVKINSLSLAAIGAIPNANGGSISNNVLTLQPASPGFGGIVDTQSQFFTGAKKLKTDSSGITGLGLFNNVTTGGTGLFFGKNPNQVTAYFNFENSARNVLGSDGFHMVNTVGPVGLQTVGSDPIVFKVSNALAGYFMTDGLILSKKLTVADTVKFSTVASGSSADSVLVITAGGVIKKVTQASIGGGGGGGGGSEAVGEVPGGTIDGSNAIFTLAHTPTNGSKLYVRGSRLAEGVDYTRVTTTITITNSIYIPAAPGEIIIDYGY